MELPPRYLVRYGLMGHVGRFAPDDGLDTILDRGQAVVLHTDRGLELGEVLLALGGDRSVADSERSSHPRPEQALVLRPASPDDLDRARRAEELRMPRLAECEQILLEGDWPLELIDVEPLLDPRTMIIHYLGPRRLELATLRARFRAACDFDVVFEPVGGDADELQPDPGEAEVKGSCSDCDCSGGGCNKAARSRESGKNRGATALSTSTGPDACGVSAHSGCSSCGISELMATRRRPG